ncbi:hypothetical protein LCGC14_1871100, partial [marine sediment metagenome]
MASITKYRLNFQDIEDNAWSVLFQEDAWGGAITDFTPGANPCHIRWDSTDKQQVIVGSMCDVQMVYESGVDSLYTEESQTIKVKVLKGAVTKWVGFLSPGQYYKHFNQGKYYVTLTASDGLGELKEQKFRDGSDDPYFYQETESVVISNILAKTGHTLYVFDMVDVFESSYNTAATDSVFLQTYIYQEMFWDEVIDESQDCYTVLEAILKKYGARIYHWNEIWRIYRINSVSLSSIRYRSFLSGVYQSNGTIASPSAALSSLSMQYVYTDAELSKMRSVGSTEITAAPQMRDNILKNGVFDDFTWTGGSPYYWTDSGTPPSYNNTADALAITIGSNEATGQPANYISCSQFLPRVKSLRLTFNYRAVYTGSPSHARVVIVLIYAGLYYTTAGTWSADAYPTSTGWEYDLIADSKASMASFEELVLEPDSPYGATTGGWGPAGTLEVRLYQFRNETSPGVTTNYVQFRHIFLDVEFDNTTLE